MSSKFPDSSFCPNLTVFYPFFGSVLQLCWLVGKPDSHINPKFELDLDLGFVNKMALFNVETFNAKSNIPVLLSIPD